MGREAREAIASIIVGFLAVVLLKDKASLKDMVLGGYKLAALGRAAPKWVDLKQTSQEAIQRVAGDHGRPDDDAQLLALFEDARFQLTGADLVETAQASKQGDLGEAVVRTLFRKLPFDGHDERIRAQARRALEAVTEAFLRDPEARAEFQAQALTRLLRSSLRLLEGAERQDEALTALRREMEALLQELRGGRLALWRPSAPEGSGRNSQSSFVAFSYEQRMTRFIGRETEREALQDFLASVEEFHWWQASGSGGQGKSRLALELLKDLDSEWDGGFLPASQLAKADWMTIRFAEPTLIVVDYVAAPEKAAAFAEAAKLLAQRARGEFGEARRLGARVRLLALEREGFDLSSEKDAARGARRDWLEPSLADARTRAALERAAFLNKALLVEPLSREEMAAVMRSWRMERGKPPLSEAEVEARLKGLEGARQGEGRAWRPLLAMMFADQEGSVAAVDEGFENLLRQTLEQERRQFWRDKEGPQPAAGNLAALACMTGGLNTESLAAFPEEPEDFYDFEEPEVLRDAWHACGFAYSPDPRAGVPAWLEARTPDLLGEYLAIWLLHGGLGGRAKKLRRIERLARDAWTQDFTGFLTFLIRLQEDFPRHEVTQALLQAAPRESAVYEVPSLMIALFAGIGAVGALERVLARSQGPEAAEALGLALIAAAENGRSFVVEMLLAKGVAVDQTIESGTFPLLMAAQEGHEAMVGKLLEAGAQADRVNERNGTFPLLQASLTGHEAVVGRLLEAGAAPDQLDPKGGAFPLLLAAQNGHEAVVGRLLGAGAQADRVHERNGAFPLLMAAQDGHEAVVGRLLATGAAADQVDPQDGLFPLLLASQNGHEAVVGRLLEAGAHADQINEQGGGFPLLIASENGHEAVVGRLLAAGAAPDQTHENGNFPLLLAAQEGHEAVVGRLLEAGATPDRVSERNGDFPLLTASKNGREAVIRMLLEAGAAPDQAHENGSFPLLVAAAQGHEAVVGRLLEAGAAPDQLDPKGGAFPLLLAAQNGHEAVVGRLLGAGAQVDRAHEQGGSVPLLLAAQNGHEAAVGRLLEAGAHADQINEQSGNSPLLLAAQNGYEAVVRALLEAGARADQAHDPSGTTPLALATQNGHEDVVRLLKSALTQES
ncbi:ankyrin repeat domain-containing protein [Neomegalonema sp.]|uniref:ankyrin repeat domain-containing protein n=1 Tax=Neomegalonema sp. TaxID=2039713 RepID=UPI00261420A4|nr:ankyrin repeat domain-containing protein [Neomegalonema sp.]MDD2869783.1 ankyrin repeat domain-containing protein [Neomegalonema sp.]